jgi:hypothetical protein
MQGASFAIGQGEPYLAIINIQAANAVLPPTGEDEEGNKVQGYAVNLDDVLPKITPRNDNEKMYFSESLKADVNQWVAINTAMQRVAQAISRYAHDNKDKWGSV